MWVNLLTSLDLRCSTFGIRKNDEERRKKDVVSDTREELKVRSSVRIVNISNEHAHR